MNQCAECKGIQTSSLFFVSRRASSPRSTFGRSLAFGTTLDIRFKTLSTGSGGFTSSAILKNIEITIHKSVCAKIRSNTRSIVEIFELTLHMGATRTTPSHSFGSFKWIFKVTAPPMDCPNMKWGNPFNSGLPASWKRSWLAIEKEREMIVGVMIHI